MNIDFKVWAVLAAIVTGLFVTIVLRKKPKAVHETTPGGPYAVIITADEIACEHPKRPRESIKWDGITEIRLVTTSDGPWQPDEWYVFIGESGGCSIPSEAKGFERLWDEFKKRFPGLDYEAIINAGTSDNQKTIWKKGSNQTLQATAKSGA